MVIQPNWPAPTTVRAFTTLRKGGVSLPPYDEFNLAHHVGDQPKHVSENRELLRKKMQLPAEPIWLTQTHSTICVEAIDGHRYQEADASYTHEPNRVCAVLTADCLPILLCNREGTFVAAIHAGWRGLANGVIGQLLQSKNEDLMAWLGPAIGPNAFEVGEEVKDIFLAFDTSYAEAFKPSREGKWLLDIYSIAKFQLKKYHVTQIYGGDHCTFSEGDKFFSYRRDGSKTGRMATLIWVENPL